MNQYIPRVDCHNHTRYSNLRLRDALATPEALINKAIDIGLKGIAITDHEALSAHPKAIMYYEKIKKDNPDFKLILGNEIYLVDELDNNDHYHYILLAKDAIGHRQLRRLSTIAWLNSSTKNGLLRVDTLKSDLQKIILADPGHLIASTACLGGELGKNILKLTKAENLLDSKSSQEAHQAIVNFILWNKELFGDDFYLEVQPGTSTEQKIMNRRMLSISQCFNIKMIVTSDTHYLEKKDRFVHKSFLNSENKDREVDSFYQDTYLHSEQEIFDKLAASDYDRLFIKQLFDNSMEIYNKVQDYTLLHKQQVPQVSVKNYPITNAPSDLINYPTLSQMYQSKDSIDRYWVNECINKLHSIGKYNKEYLDELEEEAEVKTIVGNKLDTNMFSYPIALAHYIDLIWNCDSTVGVGRGSACSALNHYLLGITQLDPLEWNFPFFRYMNRDTEGLGDIDIDVSSNKAPIIIKNILKERSQNFSVDLTELERRNLGANYVCTFGTESSKSAVLTACRGYRSEEYPEGIDVDTAQYLSSLIPQERGFVWSISDTYYGNKEKGRRPVNSFVIEINKYPNLLDIILGIEGCISKRGRHASGVLFLGQDPYEFNAFMKTPSGEVVTQYDLHDAEACGSVKMDILVTEVQDKLIQTIKLLQKYNVIEPELSLKEAYDKYLHPDILPLDDLKTWKAIQEADVLDLFQLDSDIGRQGAKKIKPTGIIELSSVNGLIRLMTAEKGQETWLEKYVRYKENKNEYLKDIEKYNLTKEEKSTFDKYLKSTLGIGISQEQLMRVLMDKNICNYSLNEANKARKIVSKKKMSEIPNFKKMVYEKAVNHNVADYVWDYVVAPGLGYSFSDIHSLSYSFIGFQTAYVATHWNPIFWNTACLIVNSGALQDNSEEEIVDIYAPEQEDLEEGVTFTDLPDRSGKIRKTSSTDYAKLAKAIGDIRSKNIKVSLVDINKSQYSFEPDIENNEILFGLKGLNKVGDNVIEQIIANRPYKNLNDFMEKCPLNKTVMISLIKAGAFDSLDKDWAKNIDPEPRKGIMAYYLSLVSEPKKKLNLQNFNSLIQKDLIPEELSFQKRTFIFNKALKDNKKYNSYYILDGPYYTFYETFFNLDNLEIINGVTVISQKVWDKIYKTVMDKARNWIKDNQEQLLDQFNTLLFTSTWNKYAQGSISAWEMESLCFYYHEHELANVNTQKYGISDFNTLDPNPAVDHYNIRKGVSIPIYKIYRIIGTVLSKNDARSSISLLTTTGVVNVKFSKEYYANFKRQISEIQPDGSRKTMEKGWMSRGTKLLIAGFRRDDTFNAKTYTNTGIHQLYKITNVTKEGDLETTHERYGFEE